MIKNTFNIIVRQHILFGVLLGAMIFLVVFNSHVIFITDVGWKIFNWVEDQDVINSQYIAGWDFAQFYRFYIRPFVAGNFSLSSFDSSQLLKIHPPFMAVILSPLGFLTYPRAYYVHIVLLTLANFSSLLLFSRLCLKEFILISQKTIADDFTSLVRLFLVNFLVTIIMTLHFLSWGFAYSIEKGNTDAYPMFFMILGLALLKYKPNKIFLQVLVFTMATYIKIYPAIIFPLLIWKHRQKAIIPIVLLNCLMAFGLGWENFVVWVDAVMAEMKNVASDWPGSSSTGSYIRYILAEFLPIWASVFNISQEQFGNILKNAFNTFVVLIWGITSFIALRGHRRLGDISCLLYMLASLGPIMVIPAYSNPYKLIYMSLPILFMLIVYAKIFVFEGRNFALGVCIGLLLLFGLLSRSQFGFLPNLNTLVLPKLIVYYFAYNKFPLILLIQVCVLITTFYLYRRSLIHVNQVSSDIIMTNLQA